MFRCSVWSCCCSSLPLRLSACSLFRVSLSSRRVRFFFLRLSCLSLVFVLCSPDSFFTLWVSYFSFHLWPTLSLLCVSPLCCLSLRLSRGFFSFVGCLLRSVVYSLSSASLSFAAVALTCASSGFPVSLLAGYVLLPHSTEVVFLAFFLLLFPSVGRFVCRYLRLSSCWFALVLPFCDFASMSSSFSPVRLLRLEFRFPYSLFGYSNFSSTPSVSSFGYWLCLFFSLFFFLVSLSSGVSAPVRQSFS